MNDDQKKPQPPQAADQQPQQQQAADPQPHATLAAQPGEWWLDRAREPSTYQGLSLLAGLLGQRLFGDGSIGMHALDIGLAIAGVIQVGKREPVFGRDY